MAWFHTPLGQSVLAAADASAMPAGDDDIWYSTITPPSAAGVVVTPDSAMQSSAVFSCVRVIAETVGSIPLITYKRLARGKERADQHPLFNLLRYSPNSRQNALEFVEMMTGHCALRGNAYAEPRFDGAGRLKELWPLHPDHMQVDLLDNGRVGYLYRDPKTGIKYRYNENEIFHLRGFSSDGITGMSPIAMARNAIGLALAAEDYGSRFFRNDATPRLLLKHPSHFKDKDTRDEFKRAWQASQAGANRFRTAVLEDGLDVKELGVSNVDAEFIVTRKYQVADIARVFRVPLVLIGETEKSTSWGTGIEQFMQAFVTHTIRPWTVRWEQTVRKDFLADDEGNSEFFAEFLLDALLRGDTKTRFDAYSSAIAAKWMVPNEARERENMNPIEGGDEPVSMPGAAPPQEPKGGDDSPADDADTADQADALAARELRALRIAFDKTVQTQDRAAFSAFVCRFYGGFREDLGYLLGRPRGHAIADARMRAILESARPEAVRSCPGVHSVIDEWEVGAGTLLRHFTTEETA